MADAATDFESFASSDSYVNLYVAIFYSLNIFADLFSPPCRAFLNLSTSEAKWHRWIGRPKSDTPSYRWGYTAGTIGSNEWESTHAWFIMTRSRFSGPKSIVKLGRFRVFQGDLVHKLGKKGCFQCSWKRFQQIPQTIFSPVFFLIPRILGVKVFIAS